MLKRRILTALALAVGLLTVLFVLPNAWALAILGVIIVLGAWEWAAFGGVVGWPARLIYAVFIAVLMAVAWHFSQDSMILFAVLVGACLWWCFAFLWLTVAPGCHRRFWVLFCGIPVLVPTFVAIAAVQGASSGAVKGPQAVLWLFMLVIGADIGAYFGGRAWGRTKLAPLVSPRKTWEGVLAGVSFAALVAWAGAAWFGLRPAPTVAFGTAVVIFSIVGDLTESMFKRFAGLKDSGTALPGHGGVLDRIDSITAAAPLYALGLYSAGKFL
jgi:phosphatidate cytidylyltransferase